MTYTRYARPVLQCDDPLCPAEIEGSPEASPQALRNRARSGGWVHRDHHDYCRKHARVHPERSMSDV